VAGVRVQQSEEGNRFHEVDCERSIPDDDAIICRCERVTKGEIVELIRAGYRDLNHIKAALRTGMGACGGRTCEELIFRLFRQEGIDPGGVTGFVKRPPDMEIPLGRFAWVE
jgi:bacterioferritin-associated ferredoxin